MGACLPSHLIALKPRALQPVIDRFRGQNTCCVLKLSYLQYSVLSSPAACLRPSAASALQCSMFGRDGLRALRGVDLPLRSLFRAASKAMRSSFPLPPKSPLILRRMQSTSAGDEGSRRQENAPSSPSPVSVPLASKRCPFTYDDGSVNWYCTFRFHCSVLPFLNLFGRD